MTRKPSRVRSFQGWAVLLLLATPALAQVSPECAIANVTDGDWTFGLSIPILDTAVGETFIGATAITEITSSEVPSDLETNAGPYIQFGLENGNFVAYLLDAFAEFEEHEYVLGLTNNLLFPCHGSVLIVTHVIQDTNNHSPVLQSLETISLATPLTAGAHVPDEIIVRDVDLTTSSITFEITENDYFDVQYIGRDSENRKNFHARLVTKRLILGLPEPVQVTITATDNDLTGDPQRYIQFTLTILADPELSIPPSPAFSQAYYSGSYTAATGLVTPDTIELIEGYDSNVVVALSGDDASYFTFDNNNGVITLSTNTLNPISVPVPNNALTFTITASRQDEPSITGSAAVFISVPEEPPTVLQFEQSYYSGTIENGQVIIPTPISLTDGIGPNVQVLIINEQASYFTAEISGNVVVIAAGTIPGDILETNTFVNLVLEASEDDSVSARTVVTLTIVPPNSPVFSQDVYSGSYHLTHGLQFNQVISLIAGFDETVTFHLDGDHSSYFEPEIDVNEVTLSVVGGSLPASLVEENDNLFFLVVAVKGIVSSSAAVHISLPLDLSLLTLQFGQNNYVGTIENAVVNLPTAVTLLPGFGPNVDLQIVNENVAYFTAILDGNQVTISAGTIPEEVLTTNAFLNLVLEATEEDFVSATTVVTLTIIAPNIIAPVFSQSVYGGSYHPADGLTVTDVIHLTEGFDETVEFHIEGEHAVYFGSEIIDNQVILSVNGGSLPLNVIEENENLIFLVVATKDSFSTTAAVHISLPIDVAAITLQFGQDYYTGTIENGVVTIPSTITLTGGFGPDVNVEITNEHQEYFTATLIENVVTITTTNIPAEVLDSNDFLNLVLEASEDGFASATAVITLTVIREDPITPVFSQSLYSGSYDQLAGLQFTETISLIDGFDETVQFTIEGDHSVFFEKNVYGNEVTLAVIGGSLPANVFEDNVDLVFLVVARKGTVSASAAIHISLTSEDAILQFQENYYSGTIENGQVILPTTISLTSGHGPNVAVDIINEHAPYFAADVSGSTITITAANIPDAVLADNTFLNLVLEASEPDFVSAITVVTLEVVTDDPVVIIPVFSQSLYSGSYDPGVGLQFTDVIELIEGFDDTVSFAIEGDHSAYFTAMPTLNAVTLAVLGESLPANVLEENSDLIFLIVATKGTISSSAAIHISLPSDTTVAELQFEQDYYVGTIENGQVSIPTIISLVAGHGPTTLVEIINEHSTYFTATRLGSVITIIAGTIPDLLLESNTFLNLVLSASESGFVSTTTIITLSIVPQEGQEVIVPVFSQTFYSGSYTSELGFVFTDTIELSQGFDENVQFSIEGEHATYFQETAVGNSVTLAVNGGSLPPNVVEDIADLIFLVVATNGEVSASAAVHVSLPLDASLPVTILRFEQDVYEGLINDGALSIPSISLSEDHSPDVQFNLIDAFNTYFAPDVDGNQVTIVLTASNLPDAVTEEPFINLVLEASGDGFVSTTTVITIATGTSETTFVRPVFSGTYYRGSYEPTGNLELEVVTLSAGYDETVEFDLEGDHSAYFTVSNTGPTVDLVVLGGFLPATVLETNNELLFAVTATKDGVIASAAIHLSLPVTSAAELTILRFEQDVYEGLINDGALSIPSISLSEDHSPDVQFNLIDAFNTYFAPDVDGNQVTIVLTASNLPDAVTEEPFINLVLEASGDGFVSTTTVITIATGTPETTFVRPVFSGTYYRGSYEPTGNLELEAVTLSAGHDETVEFDLEGDHSAYFTVSNTGPTVNLAVLGGFLPETVLETNNELLFAVTATKDGVVASAAIHLALPITADAELTILRFEQDVYEGLINDGALSIPSISLSEDHSPDVQFNLIDAFNTYFAPDVSGNQVTIVLTASNLPDAVTEEPFINLVLEASGDGFVSTTTVITIATGTPETTFVRPVFSGTYYRGSYEPTGNLELEVVTLSAGYDETVEFDLEGDHSAYFTVSNTGPTVNLAVLGGFLPETVLETNNELLFAVTATKDGVVASAAIHLSLPVTSDAELTILRFEQDVYEGLINDGALSIPSIISLSEDHSPDVQFNLIDAFNTYFAPDVSGNQVTIVLTASNLPDAVTEEPFINLVLEASGDGFVSTTTVITIATGTPETTFVRPVFSGTYYRGSYEPTGNLELEVVTLSAGYDETVEFDLEGDHSAYFAVSSTGPTVDLVVLGGFLPATVLETNNELLFAVTATKDGVVASAAIHLSLPVTSDAELTILRFEQDVYEGLINDGALSIPSISLSEDHSPDVQFNLIDAFNTYFAPDVSGNQVTIVLTASNLPDAVTEEPFINLVLEASGDGFVSTTTVITIATGTPETTFVRPVFSGTYYRGSYEPTGNLELEVVTLSAGYDETVEFDLEGDHSAYFTVSNTGPTVNLAVLGGFLPETVLETNNELLFAVTATKDGVVASAAIHLSLPVTSDAELTILRFEQDVYEGLINDGALSIPSIISLSEDHSPDVQFNLIDAFNTYFAPDVSGNQVTIVLTASNLPDAVTEEPFINLVLEASGDGFVSTTTVITIATGTPETTFVRPVFSGTYYRGSYEPTGNLELEVVTLSAGYDETVEFDLEGDHSAYFAVSSTGPTVDLVVLGGFLPATVLETNNELLFAVTATKDGVVASAAIHLSLPVTSDAELTILRFEQDVYEGLINDGALSIPSISLSEDHSPDVQFNLIDAFNTYFAPDVSGNQVTIVLTASNLPDAVTEEPFINLVLEASGDGFVSTTTVITIATGTPETTFVRPVFSGTYYRGSYEPTGNLELEVVTLSAGYDETVEFDLEGDHSAYFTVSNTGPTVNLAVLGGFLPETVLETNNELLFAVTATKDGVVASAAIHLSLPVTSDAELTILRFEQDVYEGLINDGALSIPSISLSEDHSPDVQFNLIDAFNTYFAPDVNGNQVTIVLTASNLPDAVTEEPFINLVLEASGDGFVSTTTVITIATGTPETTFVRPVFSGTYYRGSYEPTGNLELEVITLSAGYDETVQFDLEGDHSAYFTVSNTGPTVNLAVLGGFLPETVLETNNELLFAVTATKDGVVASAAIHLSLPVTSAAELTILRFEQDVYEGLINDGALSIPSISLSEDHSPGVQFNLIDAFNTYFAPDVIGNQVTIVLIASNLPDAVTEEPFINLVLEASGEGFVSTTTVITIATGTPETTFVRPVFSGTYYRGSYEPTGNLELEVVTLSAGYDDTVEFDLEGDHAEYFTVSNTGPTVDLVVLGGFLPATVLETNNELLFAVTATKGGVVASAAIHLALPITSDAELTILRFEQDVYEGLINDGALSIPSISLSEDHSPDVQFNLIDAFNTYFAPDVNGNQVTIVLTASNLPDAVTEEPFINLVLEASGDGFVSTTTVITIATGTPETTFVRPVFSGTYYRGSYEPTGNLELEVVTLSAGYDETVEFDLEGDHAEYFTVSNTGPTVDLVVLGGFLPATVLETNNELLFAVTATKGGVVASAAIHLVLPVTSDAELTILRFEQDVYEGVINDGTLSIPSISLSEDHSPDVQFNLIDAFNTYFEPEVIGNQVTIVLTASNLPDAVMEEPFINLVLEASGDGFVSTTTVITIATGTPETTFVRPVFSGTYYRGSYEPTGNLELEVVTLSAGYDETVEFDLEGDHAEYFTVSNTGPTVDLVVLGGFLPATVLETNNELLFAVTATKGGVVASAAIHLSLPITSDAGHDHELNPLIILERVEEQDFDDLVTLNSDLIETCRYEIVNSWPADQDWFYINENHGLSMRAVDREHPSIAHIHLSQVQIELALTCDNYEDFASQTKTLSRHVRNVESVDFGNRQWIITNEIMHSRSQTVVNVVIIDINDNPPVFVTNGNDPLTIGYPDANALEFISPSFFAQVQATDADIGINAEIQYSVQNQMFTIHPETGVLYLMPQAMSTLTDQYQFSVQATDENGSGHTTSLNIRVRLLTQSQIATLTIDNAFLESEAAIIQSLSQQLNFKIRSLAAVVVPSSASDFSSSYASRIFKRALQRDTPDLPTLTVHVYALDANWEPVESSTLVSSISNLDDDDINWEISSSIFVGPNAVTVVEESSAGLLAATISLSILVAILVIGIVGWIIYTIRSNRYKNFSGANSVSSINQAHPGNRAPQEALSRDRDDLNAGHNIAGPYSGVIFNTITENQSKPEPAPRSVPVAPLINIFDELPELGGDEATDEDEFGEVQSKRRKSVVTFNEYVEQINIEKAPVAEFERL